MSDTGARDKEDRGLTAAEYVLGVLDADARRAAERRIARDMVFAREVAFWEKRLGELADVPEVAPPADGWACIEAGLGSAATTEEPHGMWQSLTFWRGLAMATSALAVARLATLIYVGAISQPGAPLLARLYAGGGKPSSSPPSIRTEATSPSCLRPCSAPSRSLWSCNSFRPATSRIRWG
jgi:anti-sigma-K factor RskA